MPPAFKPWPKIPRLRRDIVITEKIDGTNAIIHVAEDGTLEKFKTQDYAPVA